jgi:hypothetical protein
MREAARGTAAAKTAARRAAGSGPVAKGSPATGVAATGEVATGEEFKIFVDYPYQVSVFKSYPTIDLSIIASGKTID